MRKLALRVERRRLLSVTIALAFCLSAMFGLLVPSSSDRTDVAVREGPVGNGLIPVRTLALTSHDPILIDGNSGFTGPNATTGVTRGSGTEPDPYVIEGWEISSFPENGIEIRNADVYFVIQDCHVHQGGGWGVISLYSSSNGTISNCSCTEHSVYGIYLYFSYGNSLVDNNCSDNYGGVAIEYSDSNNLVNNTCWTNGRGMDITSSNNNTLVNNSCSSYWGGVSLYSCVNTTLHQNEFDDDGVVLWGDVLSHFNTHSIDMTNTANGQPICYFKDQTGITVPADAGQVIMANCSAMRIEDQNLSHTDVGIELAFCTESNVTNNNCSNDDNGVLLLFSNNNSLVNNTCSSNGMDGIYLTDSSNNSLSGNNCSSTSTGIRFYSSHGTSVVNNNCSDNEYGIRVFDSDNVSLTDNNFSSNTESGIELENCDNAVLLNNSCLWDDGYGIVLETCVNVTLRQNVLVGDGVFIQGDVLTDFDTHSIDTTNTVNGKPIYYYRNQQGLSVPAGAGQVLMANCTNMHIENQDLSDASVGIQLVFCTGIDISNNNCSNNQYGIIGLGGSSISLINNTCSNDQRGIVLSGSDNSLVNNNCSSNIRDGIYLVLSDGNELANNTCSSNGENGIYLFYSSGNSLVNNTCSSNFIGIQLYDSCNDNTILANTLDNNTGYGLYLNWGRDNRIWGNSFMYNNGAGDTYDPAHIQAFDSETENPWNSTDGYGNYWSDWTTPDKDTNGIVDDPYLLDGSAGAKDYYPLTATPSEPIPEFGMMPFVAMVLLVVIVLVGKARRKNA